MFVGVVLERVRAVPGMGRRGFGPADERPYRRLTQDWVRVGLAAMVLALSALHVGDETVVERDVQRFFANLPSGARGLLEALSRLGSLWAVLLVGAAALLARRWRMALVLGLAGCTASFFGRLMAFVVAGDPLGHTISKIFETANQPTYPTFRSRSITAVLLGAAPFLTRPDRAVSRSASSF